MRILVLATDLYGVSGGIAEYNRFFIKALSESAVIERMVVLPRHSKYVQNPSAEWHARVGDQPIEVASNQRTWKGPTEININDKKITILQERHSRWQYAFFAFVTLMTKGPFDLIWCGHIYMTPLAALLSLMTRSKFWLQIYGVDAWQGPSWIVNLSIRSVARVLCISRYTRKKFLSWANLEPEKVKVLPGTYDEERFHIKDKNEQRFDSGGKKIILTVGRLSKSDMYKGHDTIILLLPQLLKKDPRWVYWVAGEGDDLSRLVALAFDNGVDAQVKFLGFVKDEELPELYRTADVFIMLSKGEGFGIVYLEAIACGLPVIAAKGDGSADPLLDGRAGQLVEANCINDVINAIEQSCVRNNNTGSAARIFNYENFLAHVGILFEQSITT